MGFRSFNRSWIILGTLAVTAIACSLPFLGGKSGSASTGGSETPRAFQPRPAKLSGILTMQEGCETGYYQVRLQGLSVNSQIQVDAQTDQSGRFHLVAPPGQYTMTVQKGDCGTESQVELEENTEHMLTVAVQETKAIEKSGKIKGRLPASVLVLPKK